MGGGALDPCFAVLFEWALPYFFPISIFFFFFLPWLSFHHVLGSCLLLESHPAAPLWLALPPSLFCVLKIRPAPNSSVCGMTWQSSLRFFRPLPLLLVGTAAQDVHEWESWPLTLQWTGRDSKWPKRCTVFSRIICTTAMLNSLQNGQCNWKTEEGTGVIIMEWLKPWHLNATC